MKILLGDIGGTQVKILATGHEAPRKFASGPHLTPAQMIDGVMALAKDWEYDRVTMGYPGPVAHGQPLAEPFNLGRGWVGYDYAGHFGRPAKIINDAGMPALGSYEGGRKLHRGLGTGLGWA